MVKRIVIPILLVVFSLVFHGRHLFIAPFNGYEWRQWDTFAVIRNFTQEGMNFFTPRTNQIYSNTHEPDERLFLLDVPIYSYTVSALSGLFGLTIQTARAVNITLAALTTFLVYLYIKKLEYPTGIAAVAGILLNLSPLFQFSAISVQPDMLMLTLLVSTLLFLVHAPKQHVFMSLCTLILVTLIKPYNYLILLPLLIHTFRTSKEKLFLLHILLPPLLYIGWFTSYETSPSQMYWWGRQTWSLSAPNLWHYNLPLIASQTLQKLSETVLTIPVVMIAIFSLFLPKKRPMYIHLWLYVAGFFIFFFLLLPGNFVHVYYQLPLLPAIATLCALTLHDGVQHVKKTWKKNPVLVPLICFAVLMTGSWFTLSASKPLYTELFEQHAMYTTLGSWPFIQTIIPKDKTVMLYQKEISPVLLNMMDRNGWVDTYYPLDCTQEKMRLQRISADYIMIFRLYHDKPRDMKILDDTALKTCLETLSVSPAIYETPYISIYQK
jgi:hypothetical protein